MLTRRRQNPWTRWISIWFACVFAGGGGGMLVGHQRLSDVLNSLNKIFYIHNKV